MCSNCAAGTFQANARSTACETCIAGYYCAEGSASPLPCPGGTHMDTSLTVMTSASQCIQCTNGTSCSVGSVQPSQCLPGTIAPNMAQETCDLCLAGQFQSQAGQTSCDACIAGFFCEAGSATPVPCPGGTSSDAIGLAQSGGCAPVLSGFWAPLGSPVPELCPPSGFFCPGAADDDLYNGAKPIIVPTGGSTTTEQVTVITKSITLELSINEYNETAVKEALAIEYNVPVSLISVASSAGSLVLSVTVATSGTAPDGSEVSVPLTTLRASVDASDDSSLGSTIGSALGQTNLSVSSTVASEGTVDRTVSFVCPRGKWCTAGLVVNCTERTYNPLEGQDLGTACIRCPEYSFSPPGSTNLSDCACNPGFISVVDDNSNTVCLCAPGLEITDDGRCELCTPGTYKPVSGNFPCTPCFRSPMPLAALENTNTSRAGATAPSECVCRSGYFLVADAVSGQESCKLCSSTWHRGIPGTDCSMPGITVETLPILPGFYRQNKRSQLVRRCVGIDASAACTGNGNVTMMVMPVVRQTMSLDVALEEFNATEVRAQLAAQYGVSPQSIRLEVVPGSVQLTVTISAAAEDENGEELENVNATMALVTSVGPTELTSALQSTLGAGVAVQISPAQYGTVMAVGSASGPSSCSPGYTGPYCAVCGVGYFRSGGTCETCESPDRLDPTLMISIQLGGLAVFMIVGAFLFIKFGKKALNSVKTSLEQGGSIADGLKKTAAAEAAARAAAVGGVAKVAKKPSKLAAGAKKVGMKVFTVLKLGKKLIGAITKMGVKLKVLISLFQVLNGLGIGSPSGGIQYPASFTNTLSQFDAINIDVPSLMPLDCLFGGINYAWNLVIQTSGPLVVVIGFEVLANIFRKWEKLRPKRKGETAEQSAGSIWVTLSELCSDLSFFVIFLMFPGSSTKTFKALQCEGFEADGEDGRRFLVVDYSIDCNSWLYVGFIWPYALAMVAIYPIGVPLFYALTLYRNGDELHEIQHLELSISNEHNRIKLGEFYWGRKRREYQPEIDEATERSEELQKEYDLKRNALPGKLKKLTNGYEMRTYWFEVFESCRKIILILIPVFFENGSPEATTITLIICFVTFGAYMMYAPFIEDSDDLLSQVCQMQVFFSLLSSIILMSMPDSPAMGVLLPITILVPPIAAVVFQTGILDKLKAAAEAEDNGVPTPCGRVGVGARGKVGRLVDRALMVKRIPKIDAAADEEDRVRRESVTAISTDEKAKVLAMPGGDAVLATFYRFDGDKNGTLDYMELRDALKSHGFDVSHPTSASMIKNYDDQPDGRMSLIEFAILIADMNEGLARTAFKAPSSAPAAGSEASFRTEDALAAIGPSMALPPARKPSLNAAGLEDGFDPSYDTNFKATAPSAAAPAPTAPAPSAGEVVSDLSDRIKGLFTGRPEGGLTPSDSAQVSERAAPPAGAADTSSSSWAANPVGAPKPSDLSA